jgi:riboflavin-specific deaminase-like protein
MQKSNPRVTLKFAQTLDGRIATKSGSSRWISGEESRSRAHLLRAEHAAILVGVGTVIEDNPQLTVRYGEGRDPLRIIVDTMLRTPVTAYVLQTNPENTLLATTAMAPDERRKRIESMGARVLAVPGDQGRVDLSALIAALGGLGITSVLVEGGAQVITSVLREQLATRLVAFVAFKILGDGVNSVGDLGITRLDLAVRLVDVSVSRAGHDLVLDGRPSYPT